MRKKELEGRAGKQADGTSKTRQVYLGCVFTQHRRGTIHSLQVFKSNLLTIVSDGGKNSANCIFGHKMATTFATQIVETESLKAESTFGEMIRGLNVFGFKVVKPEALGNLYAYKG